ncbi:ATP-dependent DNA helicase Rep [Methylomarinovum tepidoasis]|uniref:ATP-dependent DNA helicase Rep n=1 Tax=Methylomarinovum tepidoasis TaxID=2840183 RepID=A0AAU9C975_9GAMM|nr:UvrD-helicase domain-containing protein [Methylomarinovum sp. IN45]BCX89854.1 ATP-dependent DNA helicase Rep [Methylomarinovum sp. IN45]
MKLAELNPQQRAAVKAVDTPVLVIAGAGSGKTRVITHKIAYLIEQGLAARHIAALTFTNKAAREMKQRVGQLIDGNRAKGLTVSTFHALGLDILRREHKALGLKPGLSILDSHDRLNLLKEIAAHHEQHFHPDDLPAHAHKIGSWKNDFVLPEEAGDDPAALLYRDYQRCLKAYNAVDFDDLILLPVLLFQNRPEILEKWQARLRYLLVDEYQDTNRTQYRLLCLLTGKLGRFTVVGDDDQSIYAWRGAQPENLVQLHRDFSRLEIIKLEQNYRSTGRILKAANRLIANNPHVFEKKLWSRYGFGDPIRVLAHEDEFAEARQTAADLLHHKFRKGGRFSDYAILYRSNHQARLFERALREQRIPYFLSGGQSFFNHAEVKDVVAYLRLLVNPDDDIAFLRVANTPRREIGPATLEKLGSYAQRRHVSLFAACYEMGLTQVLDGKAIDRLQHFCDFLGDVADRAKRGDTLAVIEEMLETIGYRDHLRDAAANPKQFERRWENVRDLLDWLARLLEEAEGGDDPLNATVTKLMLLDVLDRTRDEEAGDRVTLMTLHAAKGLEFPHVYLVGMEEGLLPHQTSIDLDDIEEERRLCYVGITRAQKTLTLSYCQKRRRYGEMVDCTPSRFLEELPQEDLEWVGKSALPETEKKARGQAALQQLKAILQEAG